MRGAMQQADAREATRRRICVGARAVRDGGSDVDSSGDNHVAKVHGLTTILANGKTAMRVFVGTALPFTPVAAKSAFKAEARSKQKRQAIMDAHHKERAKAERNAKKASADANTLATRDEEAALEEALAQAHEEMGHYQAPRQVKHLRKRWRSSHRGEALCRFQLRKRSADQACKRPRWYRADPPSTVARGFASLMPLFAIMLVVPPPLDKNQGTARVQHREAMAKDTAVIARDAEDKVSEAKEDGSKCRRSLRAEDVDECLAAFDDGGAMAVEYCHAFPFETLGRIQPELLPGNESTVSWSTVHAALVLSRLPEKKDIGWRPLQLPQDFIARVAAQNECRLLRGFCKAWLRRTDATYDDISEAEDESVSELDLDDPSQDEADKARANLQTHRCAAQQTAAPSADTMSTAQAEVDTTSPWRQALERGLLVAWLFVAFPACTLVAGPVVACFGAYVTTWVLSRLSTHVHGHDCRRATCVVFSAACATYAGTAAALVAGLAVLGVPREWLWWPPKKEQQLAKLADFECFVRDNSVQLHTRFAASAHFREPESSPVDSLMACLNTKSPEEDRWYGFLRFLRDKPWAAERLAEAWRNLQQSAASSTRSTASVRQGKSSVAGGAAQPGASSSSSRAPVASTGAGRAVHGAASRSRSARADTTAAASEAGATSGEGSSTLPLWLQSSWGDFERDRERLQEVVAYFRDHSADGVTQTQAGVKQPWHHLRQRCERAEGDLPSRRQLPPDLATLVTYRKVQKRRPCCCLRQTHGDSNRCRCEVETDDVRLIRASPRIRHGHARDVDGDGRPARRRSYQFGLPPLWRRQSDGAGVP